MTARFAAVALCVLLHLLSSPFVRAQDFWNIPPSPEALGRGGTYFSTDTDDPLAPLSNPGLLGFLAERNRLVFGLYPVDVNGKVPSNYTDDNNQTSFGYTYRALSLGLDRASLQKILHIKSAMSIGFGYQEVDYTWTPPISHYNQTSNDEGLSYHDKAKTLNIGLAYHGEYLQAGIGGGYKDVTTHRGSTIHSLGANFGIVLETHIDKLLWEEDSTWVWLPSITPMISYSLSQIQHKPDIEDYRLTDKSSIGLSLTLDLRSKYIVDGRIPMVSVAFGRQVGDDDTEYSGDNIWGNYGSIYEIVLGNPGRSFKQGIEISLLETGFVRWGHIETSSNLDFYFPGLQEEYNTSGYGLRLSGVLNLLAANHAMRSPSVIAFLAHHFDLQYQYSTRSGGSGWQTINDGTSFHEIIVLLK